MCNFLLVQVSTQNCLTLNKVGSLFAEDVVLVLVPLLVVFELADFHFKDGLQLLQRVSLRLEALQVLEVLVVLLKQGLVLLLSKKVHKIHSR